MVYRRGVKRQARPLLPSSTHRRVKITMVSSFMKYNVLRRYFVVTAFLAFLPHSEQLHLLQYATRSSSTFTTAYLDLGVELRYFLVLLENLGLSLVLLAGKRIEHPQLLHITAITTPTHDERAASPPGKMLHATPTSKVGIISRSCSLALVCCDVRLRTHECAHAGKQSSSQAHLGGELHVVFLLHLLLEPLRIL